jgi:hypothetical protein
VKFEDTTSTYRREQCLSSFCRGLPSDKLPATRTVIKRSTRDGNHFGCG